MAWEVRLSVFSRLIAGVAGALMLAGAAAPVAAQDSNLKGSITVWTWPDNDKAFAETLKVFNAQHPNVRVQVQAFPPGETYKNKLMSALLAGSGPDVAMIEINSVALFRGRPEFLDLSKAPYNAGQYASLYEPFAWNNVTSPDGRIFALPKNTGPGGLFYRRDLFAAAGLPSEPAEVAKILRTWDDYIETGRKLAKANQQWMVSTPLEMIRAYTAQSGVSYFDKEGQPNIGGPVFRKAFELVKKAGEAGLVSPFEQWSPEWQGAIARGAVATYPAGNWWGGFLKTAYAQNQGGKWGVVPAPANADGKTAFNYGGDYIGVLNWSENKDAAVAFIQWVTQNDESLRIMYQKNDLYPALAKATRAEWINHKDPYFANQNLNEIFEPVNHSMTPLVTHPLDLVAAAAVRNAANNIIRKGMAVDEAIEGALREVRAKM